MAEHEPLGHSPRAVRIGRVRVGRDSQIGPFTVVGARYRRVSGRLLPSKPITVIGRDCEIGSQVSILHGTSVGNRVSIDAGCAVEQNVEIGDDCRLIYHAIVCNGARIGKRAIIGGFVGERSEVGADSRVFGYLVHRQEDPAVAWDDQDEDSPVLGDHVFVGFGAVIIGGVHVGRRSYVCAGAIVTKDVQERQIVMGKDRSVAYSTSSSRLAKSRWFSDA